MARRANVHWWRLGFAVITLLVAARIFFTRANSILHSHPALLITLILVVAGASAVAWTSVFALPRRGSPPTDEADAAGMPDDADAPARPRSRWRPVIQGIEIVGVLLLLASLLYRRPAAASDLAIDAMAGTAAVTVTDSTTRIELRPTGTARPTGLVFYPGALVDPRAYVPNLTPLAAAGYPVVIIKLPFDIAFFDLNGAYSVMDANPQITRWVVGGHSLGGVAASMVAGGSDPRVHGLLLWASYPSTSLADRTTLAVTSISGSNDGLATPAKVDAAKVKLPPDTQYVVVQGGTHSFFGDYGEQSGDGVASIAREDAQRQIQAASLDLLERVDTAT